MKIEGKEYRAFWFENNVVKFINQRKLPYKFEIYTANLEYQFVDLVNGNLYTAGVSSVYDDSGESEIIEVDFIYDPVGTDTNLIPLSKYHPIDLRSWFPLINTMLPVS